MPLKLRIFKKILNLNEVFTPGGQPSITYVDRAHLNVEKTLSKAIDLPNNIVSLTGPTKSGKTVLCKSVLQDRQYVWVDGGQVKQETDLWVKVANELSLASELTEKTTQGANTGAGVSADATLGAPGVVQLKFGVTANGSRLNSVEKTSKYVADNMQQAIDVLLEQGIALVVDDFHYIDPASRSSLIQSLKGAVYRGLKVVLLSTPHRAFDAIRGEVEVTGRFRHVTVPPWSIEDLRKIAYAGFEALNVSVDKEVVEEFAAQCEGSPLMMQRFCWNVCYDAEVKETQTKKRRLADIKTKLIFAEVAEDAGLPIYEKLARGPQARTDRIPRPLIRGGSVDIYEAILLAIAMTGPKEQLSYDQIRSSLNSILSDKVPQKIEVSNALLHLSKIDSEENRGQRAIDWDGENLNLFITDPFFRFYLRWEIAKGEGAPGTLRA